MFKSTTDKKLTQKPKSSRRKADKVGPVDKADLADKAAKKAKPKKAKKPPVRNTFWILP